MTVNKMYAAILLGLCDDIVIVINSESLLIKAASPAAVRWLGYESSQLMQMQITDLECALTDYFFWEDIRNGNRPNLQGIAGLYKLANEEVINVEKSLQTLECDGESLIAIKVRITEEQKTVAEALERNAAVLRATLESTSYGILVCDVDGHIANMNRRFAELWELSDTLLQKGDDKALYAALVAQVVDPQRADEWVVASLGARDRDTFEVFTLHSGRVLEARSQPQIAQDQVIGRVFTVEDVTVRVQAQRDLEAARDKAESASRAKTDFLSHMSHELRTPLNAIIGFAQLGHQDCADLAAHAEYKEKFRIIVSAATHLLNLINEVLNLAQVEAGKIELRIVSLDVKPVVQDCLTLVQSLADKYDVILGIPDLPEQAWVKADGMRLKQMLLNLLSNAIKYNKPKGHVWLSVSACDRGWRFAVIDDGIGISISDQAKLFGEFSRVGRKQWQVEGTGIGLAFSRKLAQLMQGELGVTSAPEQGSCFWIELPKGDVQQFEGLDAVSLKTELALPVCTVLYIEDDAFSRKLIETALRRRPELTVLSAESGRKGIALAREKHPDLIISDHHIGDISGYEVLAQLAADPATRSIPMLMLSAGGSAEEHQQALQAGFRRYLNKPVQLPLLFRAIAELVYPRLP